MASTGAQINSFEPSKSPAEAAPTVSQASAATRYRKRVIVSPLLNRVATAFHASAEGTVIRLDQLLLLSLRLLILRRPLLASPTAARHGANNCPGCCPCAGVSRDRSKSRPACSTPCGTPQALTAPDCWASLLWGRAGGYHRRVNARRLPGPRRALGLILALLLHALAFRRVDDRLLGLRSAS
jgi:hypothetical protein